MKNNMDDFKMTLTDALELPLDVALDLPKITILGDKKVDISNHKGIIEYTSELIRINSKIGRIKSIGKSMKIKNRFLEEINIEGIIERVEIIG